MTRYNRQDLTKGAEPAHAELRQPPPVRTRVPLHPRADPGADSDWIEFNTSLAEFPRNILARIFALKVQNRAIRAEENLRHYVLTGKLLDPRLNIRQAIALRFAGDGEFVDLARRAAEQSLSPDDIKRAVKDWRADLHRV